MKSFTHRKDDRQTFLALLTNHAGDAKYRVILRNGYTFSKILSGTCADTFLKTMYQITGSQLINFGSANHTSLYQYHTNLNELSIWLTVLQAQIVLYRLQSASTCENKFGILSGSMCGVMSPLFCSLSRCLIPTCSFFDVMFYVDWTRLWKMRAQFKYESCTSRNFGNFKNQNLTLFYCKMITGKPSRSSELLSRF